MAPSTGGPPSPQPRSQPWYGRSVLQRPQLRALALGLFVSVGGAGCAGGSGHGLDARAMAVLAAGSSVYSPPAVSAAADPTFVAAFEASLDPETRQRARHEPALDTVAGAVAEIFSDGSKHVSQPLTQWLFWRSGSPSIPAGHMEAWSRGGGGGRGRTGGGPDLEFLHEWSAGAAERLAEKKGSHLVYGLARVRAGKVQAQAVVFGHEYFEVKGLPKQVAPGGPLTFSLAPRAEVTGARLILPAEGASKEVPLVARPDGTFFVAQSAPTAPGRYLLEVQGSAGGNPHALLSLPIYVGVAEPTVPDPALLVFDAEAQRGQGK